MKWKSISPDSKRRDSPKFKQQQDYRRDFYNYNEGTGIDNNVHNEYRPISYVQSSVPYYYSSASSSYNNYQDYHDHEASIEMRLKEIQRSEMELKRELEFYRNQRINNQNFNPPPPEIQNKDQYYNNDADNTDEYEDEDELYFYGGGRNKQQQPQHQHQQNPKNQSETILVSDIEDEILMKEKYDPVDFESEKSTSSWSSEEEDFDFDGGIGGNKNGKKRPIKLKSVSSSANAPVSKTKGYAPKFIDLDAPTLVKLPPNPIPSTWANLIHNPLKSKSDKECHEIITDSIKELDWIESNNLNGTVQGILMRPPFDNENFTVKKWAKFMQNLLPKIMSDGYLFIWVEREEIAQVLRASEKYLSFRYVENLCWIRRDLGNKIMKEIPEKSGFFYKSKLTILILRRDPNNKCKLRHQRNPDCLFDFVGPGSGRMPDGRVYDVIETLLDGTRLSRPHLMHLWAGNSPTDRLIYQSRKHWIRVLETMNPVTPDADADVKDQTYQLEHANIQTDIVPEKIENSNLNHVSENEAIAESSESLILNEESNVKLVEINNDPEQLVIDELSEAESKLETATADNESDTVLNVVMDEKIPETINPDRFLETELDIELKDKETDKISPETEIIEHNPETNIIVIPHLINSNQQPNTFDEDFCNFIICEPSD